MFFKFVLRESILCLLLRQFLYPSEEDLYELIRFLVGRLSDVEARNDLVRESKRVLKTPEEKLDDAGLLPRKGLSERQVDPLMRMTQTPEASKESDLIPNKMEEVYNGVEIPIEGGTGSSNGTSSGEQDVLDLVEGVRRSSLRDGEQNFEYGQGQQSTSPCEHLPQVLNYEWIALLFSILW